MNVHYELNTIFITEEDSKKWMMQFKLALIVMQWELLMMKLNDDENVNETLQVIINDDSDEKRKK